MFVLLARPVCVYAQTRADALSPTEQRIAQAVDVRTAEARAFLQRVVEINSGTFNATGVRAVADVFAAQLDSLGFQSRWVPLPAGMQRAGHLFAERRGGHGTRILLIGHLDTVYGRDDPFQHYTPLGATAARGPGILDCKGGDVALLYALIALRDAGVLDSAAVAVALMGDEEEAGAPTSTSRATLLDVARRSDVALAFEAAAGNMGGASPTRLGFAQWSLQITSRVPIPVDNQLRSHPAFTEAVRMVRAFEAAFAAESDVQVYPLGVRVDTAARGGRANALIVDGGMRFMSRAQLEHMQSIMTEFARSAQLGMNAAVSFGADPYPGMPGRKENFALLAALDSISRSLGAGGVTAGDPAKRGGGDVSFVAHLVPGLDGLGPTGTGAHSPAETVDLLSLTLATKRAALLIYHLTHVQP